MSSPNEPGNPHPGDRPGSTNGSAPGGEAVAAAARGQITETGEVPPWQRGTSRTAQQPGDQAAAASGVEARVQRFISGGDKAPAEPEQPRPAAARQEPARSEPVRPEAYASELPDLSGSTPRPATRKTAGEPATARTSGAAPAARVQVANRPPIKNGPIRASMQLRRVDPWSVLKVSLVLSSALFFVWMIAVAFLYLVLGAMGVWSKLNSNVGDLLTSASGSSGGELVSSGTIFGGAALIGLVNIVLLTAMATIGAFIYNLTTDLVGGVEVTLADRD